MSKARAEAAEAVENTTTVAELRSERRLKVRTRTENVARAFVDALHDILHEETRLAG